MERASQHLHHLHHPLGELQLQTKKHSPAKAHFSRWAPYPAITHLRAHSSSPLKCHQAILRRIESISSTSSDEPTSSFNEKSQQESPLTPSHIQNKLSKNYGISPEAASWFADLENKENQSPPSLLAEIVAKTPFSIERPSTYVTHNELSDAKANLKKHKELEIDLKIVKTDKNKRLGKGIYGEVYGLPEGTFKEQSVLKISKKTSIAKNSVVYEAGLLCRLNHPNLIKILGFAENEQQFYLFLERKKDSLRKHIFNNSAPAFQICCQFISDMIEGIHYLHNQGIMHRDIHLENFLIGRDGVIVIADLGLAASLSANKRMLESPPIFLAAPEMTMGENACQNTTTDVFSLGFSALQILLWEFRYFAWFPIERCTPDSFQHKQIKEEALALYSSITAKRQLSSEAHAPQNKWLIHEAIELTPMMEKHGYSSMAAQTLLSRLVIPALSRSAMKRPDTAQLRTQLQALRMPI